MVPLLDYSDGMPKRIAIVGSGISGSLCARLLATEHHVTLFESSEHLGGHTRTIEVDAFGQTWPVDTGFMVFNDRTYPNFLRMLNLLGIEARDSDMSFSVHCARNGLEYQGSSLNGLFAQRSNLVRPSFLRMVRGILRFNREAQKLLDAEDEGLKLGEWIDQCSADRSRAKSIEPEVIKHYLLPMTAAIWSAPPQAMLEFPVKFLAHFLQKHGLLQIFDRPQWRTIRGGAKRYLDALLHPLGDSVRVAAPVTSVGRTNAGVRLELANGEAESFDTAVIAAHAPDALAMLEEPTKTELDVLGTFSYQSNEAYLHLDEHMLPTRRRAWASWNYRLAADPSEPASVTYDLSRLQGHSTRTPILQTLNPNEPIDQAKILRKLEFSHPLFDATSYSAQTRHDQLHDCGRIYYCGAYWGYGFHEDGVASALAVCRHFGIHLEHLTRPCIAASTKAESTT